MFSPNRLPVIYFTGFNSSLSPQTPSTAQEQLHFRTAYLGWIQMGNHALTVYFYKRWRGLSCAAFIPTHRIGQKGRWMKRRRSWFQMEIPVTNVMIPGRRGDDQEIYCFLGRGEPWGISLFFYKVEFLSENHFRQISLYLLCLGI